MRNLLLCILKAEHQGLPADQMARTTLMSCYVITIQDFKSLAPLDIDFPI